MVEPDPGVTITALQEVLGLMPKDKRDISTTSEVCHEVVKPTTKPHNCSYAEMLRQDPQRSAMVGEATVFVSHVWRYKLITVIAALEAYLEEHSLDPATTFFWFDMMIVNQNFEQKVFTPEELKVVFGTNLKRIGRVVSVLTPWNKPLYLERIWCLFELLVTLQDGHIWHVVMPPAEMAAFEKTLRANFENVLVAVREVDVSRAEAREESDRVAILALLEKVGVSEVNKRVMSALRGWVQGAGKAALAGLGEGNASAEAAQLLEGMGLLLVEQGDFAGAKPVLERCLAIREAVHDANHPDVARALSALGILVKSQGDLAGAKSLCERVLAIREAIHDPNHPDVASCLNNLAVVLKDQGDLAGAKPYYERSLAIREAIHGPNHPAVAAALNNLAVLLKDQNDPAGAKSLFERSLAIRETVHGPNHHEVATALNNLANMLSRSGDLAGAKALFERSLAIRETVHGPNHPEVAETLHNLALVLRDQGHRETAQQMGQRCVAIRMQTLGPDHPRTRRAQRTWGDEAQRDGANKCNSCCGVM